MRKKLCAQECHRLVAESLGPRMAAYGLSFSSSCGRPLLFEGSDTKPARMAPAPRPAPRKFMKILCLNQWLKTARFEKFYDTNSLRGNYRGAPAIRMRVAVGFDANERTKRL